MKNKTTLQQFLLILAGVVVILLIVIAPKHSKSDRKVLANEHLIDSHEHLHEHDHEDEMSQEDFKAEVDSALAIQFAELEGEIEMLANDEEIEFLYDSLIALSIKNRIPVYVAKYANKKAKKLPTEGNWAQSGDYYFKAFQMSNKSSKSMIKGAAAAYEKVMEMNPENLNVKAALGVVYMEGASFLGLTPMKGIGVLQEVLDSDPENVNAMINLGYFAIQSGQYDKALMRFEKVLEIDPENTDAYIYLTDVYLSMGETEKGVETLKKFKIIMNDPIVDRQVDDYIKRIKEN